MQKWEYIDVAISKSRSNKWVVDGKEVTESDVTRAGLLSRFGAQGWELVSVTSWQGDIGPGHTYYFKRPVAEK